MPYIYRRNPMTGPASVSGQAPSAGLRAQLEALVPRGPLIPPSPPVAGSFPTGNLGLLAGMGAPGPNVAPGGALGALGTLPGAPGGGSFSGSSFSAAPSGPDFRGYDVSPQNLVTRQGVTGVPQAVRTLLAAERELGAPQLSEVTSGFRTREEQAAAYQRYLSGQGNLAAPPGQSFHEQGEAFDISSAFLARRPDVRSFLTSHGFAFDVGGEPWHAHYTGGGRPLRRRTNPRGSIASGPGPSSTSSRGSTPSAVRSRRRPSPPPQALAAKRRYTV